jgi:serine/threonine protein kinase
MATDQVKRRVSSLLDQADAAAEQNDWQTVKARAEAALAFDPDNPDARQYLEAAARASERPIPDTGRAVGVGATSAPDQTEVSQGPALPSPFANGRYSVTKFLGEGGRKKVYLAHDNTLDRDVAFALIKTEGLDEAARRRILREVQAMGRLGDHPNIMPIFDLGSEGAQPYMVGPLMQGGDVGDVIGGAVDRRPQLEQVLRIARDVCERLSFAHLKGIVHRDLKPGNVWLTESPGGGTSRWVAKIGDFGLALPLDQSRLTREGFMVGTVAYMPPEQAVGGEITPKADLYSLGCMLYEMVTGRPPFLGDDEKVASLGRRFLVKVETGSSGGATA